MRAQLLHLSGPHRGQTITYSQPRIVLGSAPDADVRFPPGAVLGSHAVIEFVEPECTFHLAALDGQVFVNYREVREVILEVSDLIELGLGGPKMRFRVHYEPGVVCKPVHQILTDALDVGGVSGLFASGWTLQRDLFRHSSRLVKVAAFLLVVAVAFGSAYVGGAVGTKRTTTRQEAIRRQQSDAVAAQLLAMRDQFQQQLEQFRREQAGQASRAELDTLRSDLARRGEVVDSLLAHDDALRRVLDEYSRGVCLIHGVYGFNMPGDGPPIPVVAPDGTPLQLEYIGSGFLVAPDGRIITNRHVAEPWWNNDTVAPLLAQNLTPTFVRLTACFPGRAPTPIDPTTIQLSAEGVDIAVLRVAPDAVSGVPVLPLHAGDVGGFRGGRVILLGYPTGLNAVLARAEPDVVTEILSKVNDTDALLSALADRSLITPVITQGALNEVRDRRLVYDAETTSGGSGGPVFGPDGTVVGVNFAITRDFGGTNFGVPIKFARSLLEPAPTTP